MYGFNGTEYDKLHDMQEARHAKHLELVRGGMNFTQAARAVGVPKRTGKVWRDDNPRLKRSELRKIAPGTRLWDKVRAGRTCTGAPSRLPAGSGSSIPATTA